MTLSCLFPLLQRAGWRRKGFAETAVSQDGEMPKAAVRSPIVCLTACVPALYRNGQRKMGVLFLVQSWSA